MAKMYEDRQNILVHIIRLNTTTSTQRRSRHSSARILCRSCTPKRHRQLRAKDLSKVPTWWQERE